MEVRGGPERLGISRPCDDTADLQSVFDGISNVEFILQELDRMPPVLERMTRNIVADIRKERLVNEIKDIANKHNGNEQSRKKNLEICLNKY